MVSHWAKGVGVWILGFLTLLASLNALNAVVRWALEGKDLVFEPYLIEDFISKMQVTTYFWVSIIALFLFLGLTAIIAYSKPPTDPAILSKVSGMEVELTTNRSMLESTQAGLYQRMEDDERAREEFFHKVDATLRDVREKMMGVLEKHGEAIQKVEDLSRQGAAAIEKQMAELATIGTRLERLEKEFLPKAAQKKSRASAQVQGKG